MGRTAKISAPKPLGGLSAVRRAVSTASHSLRDGYAGFIKHAIGASHATTACAARRLCRSLGGHTDAAAALASAVSSRKLIFQVGSTGGQKVCRKTNSNNFRQTKIGVCFRTRQIERLSE